MQKYQVLVSKLAEKELDEIAYFIEETVSPVSADRVASKIWRSIFNLEFFLHRGTQFDPSPNIWIASVKKYKYYLIYEINDSNKTVIIHHVIHQHRNLGRIILK